MTITSRTSFGFGLIDFNSDNWHTDEWYNWTLLDALLDAEAGDIALPTVGGTASAITLDYTPNKTLASGLTIVFILASTTTGATTVAVDGAAAKNLLILNAATAAGDLVAGDIVKAVYDGTSFHVIQPVRKTGRITVTVGVSGATADTAADDLIIHSDDHAGINVLTPNNKKGILAFGDPASARAGALEYDHATDTWSIYVNAVAIATLSANGLKLNDGWILMDLNGANDFQIKEVSNDTVRFGSSGASTGFTLAVATGDVTFHNVVSFDGDVDFDGAVDLGTNVTADGMTVTDDIVRDSAGIHPYFNDALMVGGRIFIQAAGADPTSAPGDIVFEY